MTQHDDDEAFWRDFDALKIELILDLNKCLNLNRTSGSQFDRRNLVRSTFAAIEGLTWSLKLAAFHAEKRGEVQFTPGELALLSEVSYDLDDKGNVIPRPARLTLKSNIRFAVAAFAKANGVTFNLLANGDKWEAFGQAIKIRDRLVHPKSINDIRVSDQELAIVDKAITWWAYEFSNLYSAATVKESPEAPDPS